MIMVQSPTLSKEVMLRRSWVSTMSVLVTFNRMVTRSVILITGGGKGLDTETCVSTSQRALPTKPNSCELISGSSKTFSLDNIWPIRNVYVLGYVSFVNCNLLHNNFFISTIIIQVITWILILMLFVVYYFRSETCYCVKTFQLVIWLRTTSNSWTTFFHLR